MNTVSKGTLIEYIPTRNKYFWVFDCRNWEYNWGEGEDYE